MATAFDPPLGSLPRLSSSCGCGSKVGLASATLAAALFKAAQEISQAAQAFSAATNNSGAGVHHDITGSLSAAVSMDGTTDGGGADGEQTATRSTDIDTNNRPVPASLTALGNYSATPVQSPGGHIGELPRPEHSYACESSPARESNNKREIMPPSPSIGEVAPEFGADLGDSPLNTSQCDGQVNVVENANTLAPLDSPVQQERETEAEISASKPQAPSPPTGPQGSHPTSWAASRVNRKPEPIAVKRSDEDSLLEPAKEDSDDGAAYLQALGIEPSEEATQPKKPKTREPTYDSQIRHPQPGRSATLPSAYPQDDLLQARHDALVASIVSPSSEVLEQYASRSNLPRSDYITTQRVPSNEALGLIVDPVSLRSVSPLPVQTPTDTAPESPVSGRRPSLPRNLPPRPPPPSTSAPYAPVAPLNVSRSAQNSPLSARTPPLPRPQASPMSLTVPSPHTPRSASSSQLALPLVRVRITSPPHRGALRALPALILLSIGARAAFAAATWAQMVTYCARNAGVAIARRGGGGSLRVCVEERMAELTSPGGGRGVGDEEVGFGLGYYVSVEMALDDEDMHVSEGSVPVANLTIPLPTTLGEVATVFRERKDIRRALS